MSDGRIAICPGSYDPVTNGHLDIIGRAARVFDKVSSASSTSRSASRRRCSRAEERTAFLDDATAELANVEVEIFSNLLVEFAREHGASAIVKGLRAISDFEYEFEMNQLNRKLAPEIESRLHHRLARLQLPLLDRRQGDGDLRRRRLRPRPGAGRGGARASAPSAECVSVARGQELAESTPKSRLVAAAFLPLRVSFHDCSWTSWSSSTSSTT